MRFTATDTETDREADTDAVTVSVFFRLRPSDSASGGLLWCGRLARRMDDYL